VSSAVRVVWWETHDAPNKPRGDRLQGCEEAGPGEGSGKHRRVQCDSGDTTWEGGLGSRPTQICKTQEREKLWGRKAIAGKARGGEAGSWGRREKLVTGGVGKK